VGRPAAGGVRGRIQVKRGGGELPTADQHTIVVTTHAALSSVGASCRLMFRLHGLCFTCSSCSSLRPHLQHVC
jgi:hypothetical protein